MDSRIVEIQETQLTKELIEQIAGLAYRSFESTKTIEDRIKEMESVDFDSEQVRTGRRILIYDGKETLLAHAKTFVRNVLADEVEIPVLALATVCVDPAARGRGLGVQVTRRAFEAVDSPKGPSVSLFQTPIPEFYERLNCRIVGNRFVDRTNAAAPEANPWRNDIVMIYPAGFEWPEAAVDLNGPDY